MITLLVVGAIAWVLTGAVEDTIRSARGDAPRTERRGLRGYLDDRWKALADHHHAVAASGMLTASDARQARKHLARTKALKLAGFATDEDVARAKAEHQYRLGFIAKGIDPDTLPPLFLKRGQVWEPAEPVVGEILVDDTEEDLEPTEPERDEPGVSIDGHYYDNVQVWLNPDYACNREPAPGSEDKPWNPFEPNNTDTKENPAMSNTGEINSPADVLRFHNDLKTVLDGATNICDTLTGLATELESRALEVVGNITATETAAAGMSALGMNDAATAAHSLMDAQQAIKQALLTLAEDAKSRAATIIDATGYSQTHLAAILAAHDAQLAVQDARAGAGHGNLARDAYLDND